MKKMLVNKYFIVFSIFLVALLLKIGFAESAATGSIGKIIKGLYNVDMDQHYILNLPKPINATDAATKEYVDEVANGGSCDGKALKIKFTKNKYKGNLGGKTGANSKCDSEYKGYHLCNLEEILAAGRSGCLPNSSTYLPDPVHFSSYSVSALRGFINNPNNNCSEWTTNGGLSDFIYAVDGWGINKAVVTSSYRDEWGTMHTYYLEHGCNITESLACCNK